MPSLAQLFVQEVSALLFELGFDCGSHVLVADDGLLGGADEAVVKGLGIHDALDGEGQIAAAVDVGRAVSGADADRGGAGLVGRVDHCGAAGREDKVDVFVLHEDVGRAHRRDGNAGNEVFVAAGGRRWLHG